MATRYVFKQAKAVSICLFIFISCSRIEAYSQIVKAIDINDVLPNVTIKNLMKEGQVPLTTEHLYKNGMLLVNFWATWCTPCVKEMNELCRLMATHPGLKVLSISYEGVATVDKFLKTHPEIAASELIVAAADQYFNKLFFHQALPHNVWVNDKGIVKAITGGDEVNDTHIAEFLKGENTDMPVKKEVMFDLTKPLHIPDSLLGFRAIFAKDLPGVRLSGSARSLGDPNFKRYFEFNSRIIDMFYSAYQKPGGVPNMYLMEIHTNDSSRYFWPGKGKNPASKTGLTEKQWQKRNTYSYELRVPGPITKDDFMQRVISDLELNLDVKTHQELKDKLCNVVTYDKSLGLMSMAKADTKLRLGIVKNELIINNVPIGYLFTWIVESTFKTKRKEPYVDKTGLKLPVSAVVNLGNDPSRYDNPEYLEKCLTEQLGLNFRLTVDKYPVLIIEDLSH